MLSGEKVLSIARALETSKVLISCFAATSQRATVFGCSPATILVPSGEKAAKRRPGSR
jgi:hypothetical protein